LKFSGKRAAAFGAYGWSGESVKMINDGLERAGFELLNSGLKSQWNPDDRALDECVGFGKGIAVQSAQNGRETQSSGARTFP